MPSYICDASGTFILTKCDHFLSFSSVYLGILLDMMLNGLKGLCDSEEMCLCDQNISLCTMPTLRHILNCHMLGESERFVLVNNLSVY